MGSTGSKSSETEKVKRNIISWFEIPAINFHQAVSFYNQIFGFEMESVESNEHSMAYFPNSGGMGGAIVCGPGSHPGEAGPLIYLNAGNDLSEVLNKVPEAGGRIVMNKTLINKESGYFAIMIDSEGNKIALHSSN